MNRLYPIETNQTVTGAAPDNRLALRPSQIHPIAPALAATARALSDAGADVVVGSHAHVVQGTGMLGDTYVAYGLGNFVWYTSGSEAASTTKVRADRCERAPPARIRADGLPRFSTGAEADAALAAFAGQRACTDLAAL